MKDVAVLENELEYMTRELAKVQSDRQYLMRFLGRLVHPEDYGWLVDSEVRREILRVLEEVRLS
jgi:hypothetical protein